MSTTDALATAGQQLADDTMTTHDGDAICALLWLRDEATHEPDDVRAIAMACIRVQMDPATEQTWVSCCHDPRVPARAATIEQRVAHRTSATDAARRHAEAHAYLASRSTRAMLEAAA